MRSIRVLIKKMCGDPYYEPTIVVHDIANWHVHSTCIFKYWLLLEPKFDVKCKGSIFDPKH